MQGRTDKCVRPSAEESRSIYKPYVGFWLGKFDSAYAYILKRSLGNGLGKLYGTGCEGPTVLVGLILFWKLGTGSKERISGIFLCKQQH